MAVHERVAAVADWLVGNAVDFGLGTPERAGVLLVQLTQQVRVVAARSPRGRPLWPTSAVLPGRFRCHLRGHS
jgi:hypothetical protein